MFSHVETLICHILVCLCHRAKTILPDSNSWLKHKILYWGQRSRSYRGHECTLSIVSWWYTYLTNIVWLCHRRNKRPMGHIAHLRKQFIWLYHKVDKEKKKKLLTLWEFIGSPFEETWISFAEGCFVPRLVKIGSVLLEKRIF